jgi:hypothetical protein
MDDRDLRSIRGLRDRTPAPTEEVAAARRALQAAIDAEIATSAEQAMPRTRVRRWFARPAIATVMAVLVLVVAVSLVAQVLRPAPAVAALTDLARVAEAVDPLRIPPGDAVYTRSERTDLVQIPAEDVPGAPGTIVSFLLPQVREAWVSPAGERRLAVTAGEPRFFDDDARSAFYAAGLAEDYGIGETEVVAFAPPEVDVDPSTLPLDPDAMRSALVALAEGDGAADEAVAVFDVGGALLRETRATPETRAAVIRALATFGDRLTVTERSDDLLEVVVSFTVGAAAFEHTLVFDPAVAALVAERVTLTAGDDTYGVPDGTDIESATYAEPAVVPFPGTNA